ncbi:MAG: metallophosphoesterase [Myxococcota bacterium]|nr:metallophosphoesterase [Myxococcota bacterium]
MLWMLLACQSDTPVLDSAIESEPVELSLAPWVVLTGSDSALLRFETLNQDVELPVTLWIGDQDPVTLTPERRGIESDYAFPLVEWDLDIEQPDLPGLRVLHELALTDLPGDTAIAWRIDRLGGAFDEGVFRIAPELDFKAVFTGDTMSPDLDGVVDQAAAAQPDLYLHGGDMQYQTYPADTWRGLMASVQPLTAQAPFMPAIGNHEHEDYDEFAVMYTRMFEGAGGKPAADYYAYSYGGVRFLALNTESSASLGDPDSAQIAWLQQELEAHRDGVVVAYFHRPLVTLSESQPRLDIREIVHPMFLEYGVDLVLTAHNHCYERFDVDGLAYVVDGGGGALLTSTTVNEDLYPEDLARRQAHERSMGFTLVAFTPDGMELSRTNIDGVEIDRVALPYRSPQGS